MIPKYQQGKEASINTQAGEVYKPIRRKVLPEGRVQLLRHLCLYKITSLHFLEDQLGRMVTTTYHDRMANAMGVRGWRRSF